MGTHSWSVFPLDLRSFLCRKSNHPTPPAVHFTEFPFPQFSRVSIHSACRPRFWSISRHSFLKCSSTSAVHFPKFLFFEGFFGVSLPRSPISEYLEYLQVPVPPSLCMFSGVSLASPAQSRLRSSWSCSLAAFRVSLFSKFPGSSLLRSFPPLCPHCVISCDHLNCEGSGKPNDESLVAFLFISHLKACGV